MKANNGILIIDDFGRQMLSPRDLLNRWIVPLDRRVDYLTLASGMKFQVPFELMVVFSTNLNPHDLADEAFLRRIQTKVLVDNVSAEVFDQIFQRVVADRTRRPAEPGCAEYLRERCLAAGAESCGPATRWTFTGWSRPSASTKAGRCGDADRHRPRGGPVLRQEGGRRHRLTVGAGMPGPFPTAEC